VAKRVTFRCDRVAGDTHTDRLRNFGEDLYKTYRVGRLVQVDLGEIDSATETFSVVLRHNNKSRWILTDLSKTMADHFSDKIASMTVEDLR
jgi:hypothetical protein